MWGDSIVNQLVQRGVTYFVISPGSRSTPLTLAVARHPAAQSVIAYDERAAAYHAVGYARATARPAALVCTSGTAAANYLPAITEAFNDGVPLVALTADRPPELHGIGANQTIDQQNLYGGFVRHFVNIPPETPELADRTPRDAVTAAVERCRTPLPGPVHINCMFREPFTYDTPAPDARPPGGAAAPRNADRIAIDRDALQSALDAAGAAQRAMLVVGHLATDAERDAAAALVTRLGWPAWLDIRSGLRARPGCIHAGPALEARIRSAQDTPAVWPDFVLHLGGNVVSRPLLTFLAEAFAGTYVKLPGRRQHTDPSRRCVLSVAGELPELCAAMAQAHASWDAMALACDAQAALARLESRLAQEARAEAALAEPSIGYLLSRHLSAQGALVMGNSMPVRFCDRFAIADRLPTRVMANRGVSGIDGTLASAIGYGAGLDRRVVCLLGDVSFLHDMNSLTQLAAAPQPLIILVVNNRGGGIFHHLPIAAQADVFEPFFVTPHTYTFAAIAEQFGVAYARVETNGDFVAALADAMTADRHTILELTVDQSATMDVYRRCTL